MKGKGKTQKVYEELSTHLAARAARIAIREKRLSEIREELAVITGRLAESDEGAPEGRAKAAALRAEQESVSEELRALQGNDARVSGLVSAVVDAAFEELGEIAARRDTSAALAREIQEKARLAWAAVAAIEREAAPVVSLGNKAKEYARSERRFVSFSPISGEE